MDPTNSSSMKKFQLCELTSCTDLPCLDGDQFQDYSSSEDESEEDSGLVMIGPADKSSTLIGQPNKSSALIGQSLTNGSAPAKKEKILNMKMVNEGIRVMSYAVRGPLLLRANEIEKELAAVR